MAVPSLPAQGSPDWFGWAQGLHNEVATGRLSDVELRAALVPTGDLRAFKIFMPENYGAVGDGAIGAITGTDDGAAINSCIAAATAAGGIVQFAPGKVYKTTVSIVAPNGLVQIEGNGATIQSTSAAFDIVSLGPTGLTDVARTGGWVRRLNVRGPGGDDSNAFATTNYRAGIVWNSTRHARTEDCYVTNVDIAYDLRGNCYGHKFRQCRTGVTTNVGILLRGGAGLIAGSGSDVQVDGFWGGGAKAAFWMEGNSGGFWFTDCKPGGGHAQYASDQDGYGVFTMGLTYEPQTTVTASVAVGATTIPVADGTKVFSGRVVIAGQEISVNSKSGNNLTVPASGVGSVTATISSGAGVQCANGLGNVSIVGGGIEGTTRVHAVRMFEDVGGFGMSDFSINSNGGNDTTGLNQLLSVIKHTRGGAPSISLRNVAVLGRFRQAVPVTITQDYAFSPQYTEVGCYSSNGAAPTFAGTAMSLLTKSLAAWSALTAGVAAIGRAGLYTGTAFGLNEFAGPIATQNSNYTIQASDAGGLVIYDVGGTAGTYTLPATAPVGFTVTVAQGFSGQLTVTAAGSAGSDGIRTPTGIFTTVKTKTSGSMIRFVKDSGTRWYAMPFGDAYVAP